MEWQAAINCDWPGALQSFRRSLSLNPNYAESVTYLALLLSSWGRHDEAIATIDRARALDPLSAYVRTMNGLVLYHARRYQAAGEPLREALAIAPDFWIAHMTQAKLHERLGDLPAALESCQKAFQLSGGHTQPLSVRGYVLARSGRPKEARELAETLQRISKERFVPPYNIALVYAGLGEADAAFAWLEKAYQARDVPLARDLLIDPRWDGLRSDPRFADLQRRCGLGRSPSR